MFRTQTSLAVLGSLLFVAASAYAGSKYQAVDVTNGGAIQGVIKYGGSAKPGPAIKATKDPSICGATIPNESLILGAGNTLGNAVVYLADIHSGKKAEKTNPMLDQNKCHFVPHVLAVTRGTKLTIRNSDGTLHNVHAVLGGKRDVFNLAMPMKGQKLKKKLKYPGLVKLKCDAGHTWMSGYIHVFKHPYFVVTGTDGAFKIENVPAGTYDLVVWHESGAKATSKVTVTAGGTAEADLTAR